VLKRNNPSSPQTTRKFSKVQQASFPLQTMQSSAPTLSILLEITEAVETFPPPQTQSMEIAETTGYLFQHSFEGE
jgi:hypothetical protein